MHAERHGRRWYKDYEFTLPAGQTGDIRFRLMPPYVGRRHLQRIRFDANSQASTVRYRVCSNLPCSASATQATQAAQPVDPNPLTAEFIDAPASHDGTDFDFEIAFSEPLKDSFSYSAWADHLTLSGASFERATRIVKTGTDRNRRWRITLSPTSATSSVSIVMTPTTSCTDANALCTEAGSPLSEGLAKFIFGNATDVTVQEVPADPPTSNTVVLEPNDPRGSRDIGTITLVSSQPGTIQASWQAPTETPADYRISWAKAGESFKTWTDNTGNAFPTAASYTITGLEGGEQYKVMVRARYNGSPGAWSGQAVITVVESSASKPVVPSLTFGLAANYPNPFNPETQIAYSLSTTGPVELAIYTILGQRVRTLVQETQAAGSYQVSWNGRNDQGAPVASGIYLYRLSSAQEVQMRRLLLLK